MASIAETYKICLKQKTKVMETTKSISEKINSYYEKADKLATKEVERLARLVLTNNPKKVSKFMMAMGSFFFIDNNDEIIHEAVGGNQKLLESLNGYNELVEFIDEWDEKINITGEAMTFTAKGKKITNW